MRRASAIGRLRGIRLPGALAVAAIVVLLLAAVAAALPSGIGRPSDDPATASRPPRFVEEAQAAGVDHRYDGEFLYFVGGGVAVLDCDGDHRPDIYLAGGSESAALYRNVSNPGMVRFSRLAAGATDLTAVTGAHPVDIDSDGLIDLAVLRVGEDVLLRGTGDCRFERANERWGFDGGDGWTTAFSATWEPGATWPTLAFGDYLALDPDGEPTQECSSGRFFRPDSSGQRFGVPAELGPAWCTLSLLFSDWSRTGRRDLRVSNDRHYYGDASDGEEQLWRVEPGAAPRLYTRDEGWQSVRVWGMGIASQDVTGDGLPEIYLTSQGDNKLQTLAQGPARPEYRDIALRLGVTANRPFAGGDVRPSTAWHPEFDDVDNDGMLDLFVTKGNVEAMPGFAARDPNDLLLGRPDGTFSQAADAAGLLRYERGRGAAVTDLDLDGLLDIVVVNRREPVAIWHNVAAPAGQRQAAPMGHWVALRLRQAGANPDAIGAWIELRAGGRTTSRELTIGGGHAGGELGWVHFGLGGSESGEVRVVWPDGQVGPWMPVRGDGFFTVERDASAPQAWRPEGG